MAMDKIDELLEQQNKWEELIQQTAQAQKKMLEIMLQLRKEIISLSQLKKDFPDSVKINARISQCDQLLEQSSEKQLAEFREQKKALDELMKNFVEPTLSESSSSPKL